MQAYVYHTATHALTHVCTYMHETSSLSSQPHCSDTVIVPTTLVHHRQHVCVPGLVRHAHISNRAVVQVHAQVCAWSVQATLVRCHGRYTLPSVNSLRLFLLVWICDCCIVHVCQVCSLGKAWSEVLQHVSVLLADTVLAWSTHYWLTWTCCSSFLMQESSIAGVVFVGSTEAKRGLSTDFACSDIIMQTTHVTSMSPRAYLPRSPSCGVEAGASSHRLMPCQRPCAHQGWASSLCRCRPQIAQKLAATDPGAFAKLAVLHMWCQCRTEMGAL